MTKSLDKVVGSYSKKVRCTECGNRFPRSQTELLSVGKTVLRLCMNDYAPKKKSADAAIFQAAQKAEELQKVARENIKNRGESNE